VRSTLEASILARFSPPPRLELSEWIEANIHLPDGLSATPGPMKLWPWQREIASAVSDAEVERVTLLKASRIGFTALTVGAIGAYVANTPASILVLLPTESDARDFVVSDIEPTFAASPGLRRALAADREEAGRDTLTSRRFAGGSLKVVAARSPRNLRRHTARILIVDEADACEIGAEGDPIKLAERRTLTFPDRKLIVGSTPIFSDTSAILKLFGESDGRVFEVPCPECGSFHEIMWGDIEWPQGAPEKAGYRCPECKALIDARHKAEMVQAGAWRATRPEVRGHAGFRLNALVSLLANASWARLAAEFLQAKDDPTRLQVFCNTILAEGWATPAMVDEAALAARAEDFGLDRIPVEVLLVTAGCDVQDDRLEISIVGWTRDSVALVLAHFVIWGSFQDASTWSELDETLRTRWRHPHGGMLRVDAACIDAGDGDHFESVLNFCYPRMNRRIFATKGLPGARPAFAMAKGKKIGDKLGLVGVDGIKNVIFDRLQRARGIRFARSLEPVYYEQLASERRVIRYFRGQPVRRFERVGRARNESLDALVYSFAAREAIRSVVNLDRRESELRGQPIVRRPITDFLASARPSLDAPITSFGRRVTHS